MILNSQRIILFISLLIVSLQAASIEKRSPFLRLDELSNKIYLAKDRLGAGLIDPIEM
jgi:hypothetical protein